LEAQQHKKYAQTTPLDDGVSSLFRLLLVFFASYRFFKVEPALLEEILISLDPVAKCVNFSSEVRVLKKWHKLWS
jgi:hypothetical protein